MGTKKPPLRGGFFEHFTFTGDGISRVAEVESCTLSSTMWANYIEKVLGVSTRLTGLQLTLIDSGAIQLSLNLKAFIIVQLPL